MNFVDLHILRAKKRLNTMLPSKALFLFANNLLSNKARNKDFPQFEHYCYESSGVAAGDPLE